MHVTARRYEGVDASRTTESTNRAQTWGIRPSIAGSPRIHAGSM
jgi:hypothetical protein